MRLNSGNKFLPKNDSSFVTQEIPPGTYEKTDKRDSLDNLEKLNVFNNFITKKTVTKTVTSLPINGKSF